MKSEFPMFELNQITENGDQTGKKKNFDILNSNQNLKHEINHYVNLYTVPDIIATYLVFTYMYMYNKIMATFLKHFDFKFLSHWLNSRDKACCTNVYRQLAELYSL